MSLWTARFNGPSRYKFAYGANLVYWTKTVVLALQDSDWVRSLFAHTNGSTRLGNSLAGFTRMLNCEGLGAYSSTVPHAGELAGACVPGEFFEGLFFRGLMLVSCCQITIWEFMHDLLYEIGVCWRAFKTVSGSCEGVCKTRATYFPFCISSQTEPCQT